MAEFFARFDFINLLLLVLITPFFSIFFYRALEPKFGYTRFFWASFGVLTLLSTLQMAMQALLPSYNQLAMIFALLEIVLYFAFFRIVTRSKFSRILLFFALFLILTAAGSSLGVLTTNLLQAVVDVDSPLSPAFWYYCSIICTEIFQGIIILIATDVITRKLRKIEVDIRWYMFGLLLLAQGASQLLIASLLTWRNSALENALMMLVYTALCAVTDIYIARTFSGMIRNAELLQRIALQEQQQALEQARYTAASAQMMDMRRLQHDYANTLLTIRTLIEMGDTGRILPLLASTEQQLKKAHIVHTGNQITDAVLYSKAAEAEENGVHLHIALLWPESFHIPDTDLMRVVANLLDNAIRYCALLPEGIARTVEVSGILQGRMFALCVSNPYLGADTPALPEPGSDDPSALHGHGLAIVQSIAEKYGGALAVTLAQKRVTFRVLFSLAAARESAADA